MHPATPSRLTTPSPVPNFLQVNLQHPCRLPCKGAFPTSRYLASGAFSIRRTTPHPELTLRLQVLPELRYWSKPSQPARKPCRHAPKPLAVSGKLPFQPENSSLPRTAILPLRHYLKRQWPANGWPWFTIACGSSVCILALCVSPSGSFHSCLVRNPSRESVIETRRTFW